MLILLFPIASLALLVISASIASKYLEDAIESLGLSQGFLAVFVGAIGTSLAEISSSFFASINRNLSSALVYGNILGSAVFNSTLIPAVVLLFSKRLKMPKELFLSFGFLLTFYLLSLNGFSFLDSLVLLFLFLLYLRSIKPVENAESSFDLEKGLEALIYSFAGVLALVISSILLSKSLEAVATSFNLRSLSILIGMSTSLPEFILAYSMARKGKYEFGIVEALASNITNVALVPIFPAILSELPPAPQKFAIFSLLSTASLAFAIALGKPGALLLLLTFFFGLLMLPPKVL